MLILKKNLESCLVYQIDLNFVTDNIDNGSFEIFFIRNQISVFLDLDNRMLSYSLYLS